ncbi:Imm7 family immunity protein [Kitasatospora sp. NPDC096077]|uniref:Imm7 family immunity protein n=1 Tax=Kitasatospora sp. NPDC096077 TaxID=3155544 RepID=UPI00332ED600
MSGSTDCWTAAGFPVRLRKAGEREAWGVGSYGLLHVRDDEAAEHGSEVRVLRMVRGEVSEHAEPLLSPCMPVLEDPFPG